MEQLILPVAVDRVEVGAVIVGIFLVSISDILFCIEHIDVLAGMVERQTCRQVDFGSAALTFLGGNQHHTI